MSWEHFEVGIQSLVYMERRELITAARAAKMAQAGEKDFPRLIETEQRLAGLR